MGQPWGPRPRETPRTGCSSTGRASGSANEGSNTVSKLEYPFAFIDSPAPSTTFAVGDILTLSGRGLDVTGVLPPGSLSWTVLLRNGLDTHLVLGPVTGTDVSFTAPPPEDLAAAANSYLQVQLTATVGVRSTTVSRDIQPKRVATTFTTSPPGLTVVVNDNPLTCPQTVTSWQNYLLQASAPPWQQGSPGLYIFSSWSVGPGNPVGITTPSVPTTYAAAYQGSTDVGPLGFFTINPCRLVDTRAPTGPWGGPALLTGATRTFSAWSACNVPTTARAIAVNLAVTGPSDLGHLRIFPADELPTATRAISFGPGQTRSSNAIIRLGVTAGDFSVFCWMASGSTHFIVDVVGYFE